MSLHEQYHGIPKEDRPRPKIQDCIPRRLYRIDCRNLSYGVYNGMQGFIGIRMKFGHEYLFTEFHWDQGPPLGTVHTIIDTGIDLPEHIELKECIYPTPGTFTTYLPLMEWMATQVDAARE